jgi:hypothetical protein
MWVIKEGGKKFKIRYFNACRKYDVWRRPSRLFRDDRPESISQSHNIEMQVFLTGAPHSCFLVDLQVVGCEWQFTLNRGLWQNNVQLLTFLSQARSHILVNAFLLKCSVTLNNYSLTIKYFVHAVFTTQDDTILRNTSVTAYGPDVLLPCRVTVRLSNSMSSCFTFPYCLFIC